MGVNDFADSAVIIQARIRTVTSEQWSIRRAFNKRLKIAFDQEGIEIPFPQRTLHIRQEA
ncbi:MAG: mechanosensitive ion channel family protein [Bacteroidota bacterium]